MGLILKPYQAVDSEAVPVSASKGSPHSCSKYAMTTNCTKRVASNSFTSLSLAAARTHSRRSHTTLKDHSPTPLWSIRTEHGVPSGRPLEGMWGGHAAKLTQASASGCESLRAQNTLPGVLMSCMHVRAIYRFHCGLLWGAQSGLEAMATAVAKVVCTLVIAWYSAPMVSTSSASCGVTYLEE